MPRSRPIRRFTGHGQLLRPQNRASLCVVRGAPAPPRPFHDDLGVLAQLGRALLIHDEREMDHVWRAYQRCGSRSLDSRPPDPVQRRSRAVCVAQWRRRDPHFGRARGVEDSAYSRCQSAEHHFSWPGPQWKPSGLKLQARNRV